MGRNTNRRLGLVFAAAAVLICVPAALAQNEGKSDPQIAAEAAALEQQKKQQSAQQSGQDPNACDKPLSLLGVQYQGGIKMTPAMHAARTALDKANEQRGPAESQESEEKGKIAQAERDIADLSEQIGHITNKALPELYKQKAEDKTDEDRKQHAKDIEDLQQKKANLEGKLAEKKKDLQAAQTREQEIMKTLGPLRDKYDEQKRAFEAAMRAAKC